jgi:hypothetical protein
VARTYAGILGPLAFLIALARGILAGGGTDSVLWTAWSCLVAYAAIGAVTGWLAERTVEDSVNGRIAAELATQKAATAALPAVPGETAA